MLAEVWRGNIKRLVTPVNQYLFPLELQLDVGASTAEYVTWVDSNYSARLFILDYRAESLMAFANSAWDEARSTYRTWQEVCMMVVREILI